MSADADLTVVGGFEIDRRGEPLTLPLGACRLLGHLALRGGVPRASVAESLWPDRPGGRAAANLRTAVWQIRAAGRPPLIEATDGRIRLSAGVRVDHPGMLTRARDIIGSGMPPHPADAGDTIAALGRALLPDWSESWLTFDRQRWDQVRLHALEMLARQLVGSGRYLEALEAAFTAVAVEPVRESAHRTVVEVHLAEGNLGCALKHYQAYRALLRDELDVAPSEQMEQLLLPLVAS